LSDKLNKAWLNKVCVCKDIPWGVFKVFHAPCDMLSIALVPSASFGWQTITVLEFA
jgi:hypothetical protein